MAAMLLTAWPQVSCGSFSSSSEQFHIEENRGGKLVSFVMEAGGVLLASAWNSWEEQ